VENERQLHSDRDGRHGKENRTFLPVARTASCCCCEAETSSTGRVDVEDLDSVLKAAVEAVNKAEVSEGAKRKDEKSAPCSVRRENHRVRSDEAFSVVNDGVACSYLQVWTELSEPSLKGIEERGEPATDQSRRGGEPDDP
jgi:hypothetical protein